MLTRKHLTIAGGVCVAAGVVWLLLQQTGLTRIVGTPAAVDRSAAEPAMAATQIGIRPGSSTPPSGAATLAGIVEAATGAAISSANIAIYQADELLAVATSDEQGRFSAAVPSGQLSLRVDAEAYAAAIVHPVAPTLDLRIVLYPGYSLAGQVLDERTWKPVANIRVSAREQPDRFVAMRDQAVRTDAQGRFVFENIAAGQWTLQVSENNLWGEPPSPVTVGAGSEARDLRLFVQAAAPVSGRFVIDGDDEPCPAGRLQLIPDALMLAARPTGTGPVLTFRNTPAGGAGPHRALMVQVDKQGEFRFDAVPYGKYHAGPACNEHQILSGPTSVDVNAQTSVDLLWRFQTGADVTVHVTDESARPVAAAMLSLAAQAAAPAGAAPSYQRTASADANGTFRFGGLRPGRYQLTARHPHVNGAAEAAQIVSITAGVPTEPIALMLPGVGSVRIYAHTVEGRPTSRLLFHATNAGGTRFEAMPLGNGRYQIGPLPRDSYRVFAYDNKNPKRMLIGGSAIVIASAAPVEIDYTDEPLDGVLSGRVLGVDGAGLAHAFVRAVSTSLDDKDELFSMIQRVMQGEQSPMTDAIGNFRIEGLDEQAVYQLYFLAPSGARAERANVRAGDFVEVTMQPAPAHAESHLDAPDHE